MPMIVNPDPEPRREQFDSDEAFQEACAAFWAAVDQAVDDNIERRFDREQ